MNIRSIFTAGTEPAGTSTIWRRLPGMPLGGLGLPLAQAARQGMPGAALVAAVRSVTVPPLIDLGVDFPPPPHAGTPVCLTDVLDRSWRWDLTDAPEGGQAVLSGLDSELQLVHLLPLIDVPCPADYWVFEAHLPLLLRRLGRGDVDLAGLPRPERRPHPPRRPLPFAPPVAEGPVLAEHLARFFVSFPDLGARLASTLRLGADQGERGVPAALANRSALLLLGIRVDLRAGYLVPEFDVWDTGDWAGGGVRYRNGGDGAGRLRDFVDALVPRVGWRGDRFDARGAAWSCAIDAVVNSPLAWTMGEDGLPLWADEIPGLTELSSEDLTLH